MFLTYEDVVCKVLAWCHIPYAMMLLSTLAETLKSAHMNASIQCLLNFADKDDFIAIRDSVTEKTFSVY